MKISDIKTRLELLSPDQEFDFYSFFTKEEKKLILENFYLKAFDACLEKSQSYCNFIVWDSIGSSTSHQVPLRNFIVKEQDLDSVKKDPNWSNQK